MATAEPRPETVLDNEPRIEDMLGERATVIVGAQWGDEGKGKVVDTLAEHVDAVARYQGGNNAGHTIVIEGETHALHLVPSGIFQDRECLIGNGVVLNPEVLLDEISKLPDNVDRKKLKISPNAHVIMPHHLALDLAGEKLRGKNPIGTTNRGIGPCYEDKVGRRGVRVADLLDDQRLDMQLELALSYHRPLLENQEIIFDNPTQTLVQYRAYGEALRGYVDDISERTSEIINGGGRILLEGAQGTRLDIDHGTYPFVTSSSTGSWGAAAGVGMSIRNIDAVVGVSKAYCTRVGSGPFPTELDPHQGVGHHMVEVGVEKGTTTGRPRRPGWLDAAALKEAAELNGFTSLAMTKLDVLSGLDTIKLGVGYEDDGTPKYEDFPGFRRDITQARTLRDLPVEARTYLMYIERFVGVPIRLVGVGPSRDQLIAKSDRSGWTTMSLA